jgi:hypothetical protein
MVMIIYRLFYQKPLHACQSRHRPDVLHSKMTWIASPERVAAAMFLKGTPP